MTDPQGPRQMYSLETLYGCIEDLARLNLHAPLSLLEDWERQWQLKEFCTPLIHAVKHPTEHFRQIDINFSKLLPSALTQHPSLSSKVQKSIDVAQCTQARQLLSRFPSVPQRLLTLPLNNSRMHGDKGTLWDGIKDGRWPSKYVVPEARSQIRLPSPDDPDSLLLLITDLQDIAWNHLFVTSFIDTNNLVLLIKVTLLGHEPDLNFAGDFLRYINLLAELLDEYDGLVQAVNFGQCEPFQDPTPSVQALKAALFPDVADDHEQDLAVLKAFLWSAWQRSVMLYFHYVIGVQLWQGSSPQWSTLLAVKGIRRLMELDAQDYRGDGTQYLCNWAFELLRTSRSSLALDFRRIISTFDDHFRGLKGRCIRDSELTCKGDLPESCQRFTGAETKAQSLHASICDGACPRIIWSEASYRSSPTPRAVSIKEDHINLHYCQASSQTMAISHVWSHGQGGRPEDGINLCLHTRYSHLARSFGCESYWIDSTCVPDDAQLRKEAIMSINDIFCHSKVTLISDQDLQSVAIPKASIGEIETLLSILLVCDWGVRAWTMLEAIRGNRSIHILCYDDHTISLTEMLQKVHQHGAVDLAVLVGSAQHLLPSSDAAQAKGVEEVGYLLSQRHASRANDEIVIWGLLANLAAPKGPVQLWNAHKEVSTAFLISSAPRIEDYPGYGWAPQTPYVRPQLRAVEVDNPLRQKFTVRYPSYDGRGSFIANITPRGLISKWLVQDLDAEAIAELCESYQQERSSTLWLYRDLETSLEGGDFDEKTKLFPRPDYALACDALDTLAKLPHARVRILRPLDADGSGPYDGGVQRGEDFNILVAICLCIGQESIEDSNTPSESEKWQWKGVYEWIDDTHPDWKIEEMLII
ncbi:hypothetical protein MMC28_010570 [Mycoblastus sanguinarius]|nr:hypothetical protein [Mycoblastus sanguinarius]